jgi:hypothetical protein
LRECQEKLKEAEAIHAQKEEKYAKLMEWSEKAREENKVIEGNC